MHVRARLIAPCLLLASLVGCSKKNETSTTTTTTSADVISCQQKALCAEWSGLTLGEAKEAQDSCNEPGAKFGSGACSRKNVVGVCRHRDEKVTMYIYKSLAVANAKDAKEICDDGEFTAAPPASK
jgi:hypothetical protein